MKKILCILMSILYLGICAFPGQALAQPKNIAVYIDGLPLTFDVPPMLQEGRTLVPFRAVSEALNIAVDWNAETRTINASADNQNIVLEIGKKSAIINGTVTPLDVPPIIINGRTLIPLRFFAENLGCQVAWDPAAYTVKIGSPVKSMEVLGFYALGDSKTSSWKNLFAVDYPNTTAGNTGTVSDLALGWYSMDAAGNLLTDSKTGWQRPTGWEKVLEAADTYSMDTEMVIHLPDRDTTFNTLMADEAAVTKVITAISEEAQYFGGVNLDIEGLGWKEKDSDLTAVQNNFTRFVQLLNQQLKLSGKGLTLTLHPLNGAYKGYDYKALGEIADTIVIMAYDYGQKPEPVNMVTQAVQLALDKVAPEKISLGISIPNETPDSLQSKIGIAKKYNLKGIALWRLGLLSPEMWNVLKTSLQIES